MLADLDAGTAERSPSQGVLLLECGVHQFARPSRAMVAGTSKPRITVASTAIATASPSPIIVTTGVELNRKLAKTHTMIRAAEVITVPVPASPSRTDRALSPVRNHDSRTAVSRNTS